MESIKSITTIKVIKQKGNTFKRVKATQWLETDLQCLLSSNSIRRRNWERPHA